MIKSIFRNRVIRWAILLLTVIAVCLAADMLIRRGAQPRRYAGVYRDGELLYTIDTRGSPREYEVIGAGGGRNVIRADGNGAVYMAEANCRDGFCVSRGNLGSGVPIVCLPNRVVLKWENGGAEEGAPDTADAVTGVMR